MREEEDEGLTSPSSLRRQSGGRGVMCSREQRIAAGVTLLTCSLLFLLILLVMDQKWNKPAQQVTSYAALLTPSSAALRAKFTTGVNATFIGSLMEEYSNVPHIAGSAQNSVFLANKTATYLRAWGWDSVTETKIPALLTNLTYRSVNVTDPITGDVLYACSLEEDNVINETDWTKALKPSLAYSGDGKVSGKVVWANYGRDVDFAAIAGIDLTGTIVVVRYGEIFRGDKVKLAAARGAAGVIIVNDPWDVARGPVFPTGPWATNTSVQRGSIYNGEGDPLTPSWPSQFGGPTLQLGDLTDADLMQGNPLPTIPVQPMGYGDAARVLMNLAGGNALPANWSNTGFNASFGSGIGPGPQTVSMEVRRTLIVANITNVMAVITGAVEPDRTILFGSHRDAWTYGAGDPISGHSTNMEIARNLGLLHQTTGWRPRRTIQMCSWDAEEWAIIGSNEYVERNLELLRQRGVAYLNMDIAIESTMANRTISLGGSPLLQAVSLQAAADVTLPDGKPATTMLVYEDTAGSGSDHVGFIQLAGVPVLDGRITSPNSPYEAVYHSNYDSYYWYTHFGDPGFLFHQVMARLHGNIILRLADENILQMDVTQYGASVQAWTAAYASDPKNNFADFSMLQSAAAMFTAATAQHAQRVAAMAVAVAALPGSVNPYALRTLNDMSFGVERVFLGWGILETGLHWYKHMLFAPSAVDSYAATTMPLIANALATGNKTAADFAIGRVAQFVERAAFYLNSSLVFPMGQ